ncbi:MAG TPA: ATP-binding cassette domain-containing protein, partial [Longimicrobiaceae bacterium]|nr:ATP-binding cassette domain-containing protein [Longimicrobiaceae bacterium]
MIVFDNLTKRYGELTAVSKLSLRVGEGEVYALLGANGAGKTTALRCLATLLRPSAGRVLVAGFDSAGQPLAVRSRLGFLAASMGLYERLTPREILAYFADLHALDAGDRDARVEELVSLFDLTSF